MKILKIDFFFLLLLVLLGIVSIYFEYNPSSAVVFQVSTYQNQLDTFLSGLLIVFLVCFIGNILPLPTPYLLIVWIVSTKFQDGSLLIPIVCAIIASFGAMLGEFLSYWIGRGTTKFFNSQESAQIQFFQKILKNRPSWGPFLLYFFGATPLNDDLILIPLGMMKYSQSKTVLFCWLGKLTLMFILAFLPDIFNVLDSNYSFISTMLPLFGVVLIMYLLLRIDWIEFVKSKTWLLKLFKIPTDIDHEENL
jgi:membrane protein YqaA with SNARE-associated domain